MIIYIGELIGSIIYMLVGLSFNLIAFSRSDKKSLKFLSLTSLGWTLAYFLPCIPFGEVSGPHLNPALTIALVSIASFEQRFMYGYMICDFLGMIIGTLLFYIINYEKIRKIYNDEDRANIFYVMPKNKSIIRNIINEFLSTFFIVFFILANAQVFGITTEMIYVYIIIMMWTIGMLFDFTGVATNPFRDLVGRIMYLILPMGRKEKVNFLYVIITILVPIIASIIAAKFYQILPFDSAMLH